MKEVWGWGWGWGWPKMFWFEFWLFCWFWEKMPPVLFVFDVFWVVFGLFALNRFAKLMFPELLVWLFCPVGPVLKNGDCPWLLLFSPKGEVDWVFDLPKKLYPVLWFEFESFCPKMPAVVLFELPEKGLPKIAAKGLVVAWLFWLEMPMPEIPVEELSPALDCPKMLVLECPGSCPFFTR